MVSRVGTALIAGAYPSHAPDAGHRGRRRYCVAMDTRSRLEALLAERILVLEVRGTAIQSLGLSEADFRGDLLRDHPRDVQGDNDLLGLTKPEVVEAIHRDYVAAGAWIVSTNTFNASPVSQAEYGLEHLVYEMNRAAAENARRALDGADDRFVVGSRRPHALDLPQGRRPGVPDDLVRRADRRLRGADPRPRRRRRRHPAVETIFDTLNARPRSRRRRTWRPTCRSGSRSRRSPSGRNLSGQTAEAFWLSIRHAEPLIVGVNCSLGAAQMRPYLESLARIAPTYTACYPNAGLPNAFGLHDETPETTSGYLGEFATAGAGQHPRGCCGTTPEHPADRGRGPRLPPRRPRSDGDVDLVQRARAVRRATRHGLRDGRRATEHPARRSSAGWWRAATTRRRSTSRGSR